MKPMKYSSDKKGKAIDRISDSKRGFIVFNFRHRIEIWNESFDRKEIHANKENI